MKLETLRPIQEVEIETEILDDVKMTEEDTFYFTSITECNHSYFEKVDFTEFPFENISCYDVVFKYCDFSNIVWNREDRFSGSSLHSVTFDHCKMVGTDFGNCLLKKVKFQNCIGRYLNFSESSFQDVCIDSCQFQNCVLQDAKCKKLEIKDSELLELEIQHTSLSGIDVSTDCIDGLKTDLESIRGMIVNPEQAVSLSKLLGIIVK